MEQADKLTWKKTDEDDTSVYGDDPLESQRRKEKQKEGVLNDLQLQLMVKHSDPLKYYELKQKKKLEIHDQSYNNLRKLTKGKKSDHEVTGEDKEEGSSFQNKIFELLEKTNERVQLDRPFLIREKMQVIMIDSEKQNKNRSLGKVRTRDNSGHDETARDGK